MSRGTVVFLSCVAVVLCFFFYDKKQEFSGPSNCDDVYKVSVYWTECKLSVARPSPTRSYSESSLWIRENSSSWLAHLSSICHRSPKSAWSIRRIQTDHLVFIVQPGNGHFRLFDNAFFHPFRAPPERNHALLYDEFVTRVLDKRENGRPSKATIDTAGVGR